MNTDNRTISGQTVYPNNYQYSTLRAYLNGSYEEDDQQQKIYTGCGFLQKAFTPAAQELIMETEVDNSNSSCVESTWNPNIYGQYINEYTCNNTFDKIFVLSEGLIIDFFPNEWSELSKRHLITDYAKANYAVFDNPKVVAGGWLRSPDCETPTKVYIYSFNINHLPSDVNNKRGVLPALRVSELPE